MFLKILNRSFFIILSLVISSTSLQQCGASDDNLEPLPPPGREPGSLVGPYYFNQDSTISLVPDFSARLSGSTAAGNFKMTAELELLINNNSQDTVKIEPGKLTVYTISGGNFFEIGTAELVPVIGEGTARIEKIAPDDSRELLYENNPIDELIYRAQDVEFFSVFLIVFNDNDRIFVSNKAFIGG